MKKLETALKIAIKNKIAGRHNYRFTGLPPIKARPAPTRGDPRLNLVLMGIRSSAVFGGADTALRLMNALSGRFPRARIIVQSEDGSDFDRKRWPDWQFDVGGGTHPKTVGFLGQRGYTPDVHANDYFIATNWMSAHFVRAARAVQPAGGPAKFVYMIQDFEPGFYLWSGRHLLANATYARKDDVVAVFNTQLLCDFFSQLGIAFDPSFVFEPRLSPSLAAYLPKLAHHKKKRVMLVYGRPLAGRNAFDMVIESLGQWSQHYPAADQWQLVSLGERHKDVEFRRGVTLKSYGKQSLDDYASYLMDASVGFSLMVSPHPSYPPLEMAEFGARVVTNTYANKDLSRRAANIISVAETTPERFGEALAQACDAFTEAPADTGAGTRAFLGGTDEFPFVEDLYKALVPEAGLQRAG